MKVSNLGTIAVRNLKSCAALTLCMLTASCSSNTNAPQSEAWKTAKPGSTFTFTVFEGMDSLGNYTKPTKEADSVELTGLTVGAMTNVSVIDEVLDGSDAGIFYFAHLPNGNCASGDSDYSSPDSARGITWETWPLTSGQPTILDSTYLDGSHRHIVITNEGSETLLVAGQSMNTIRVTSIGMSTYPMNGTFETARDTGTVWFSPALGYLVKLEVHQTDIGSANGSKPTTTFSASRTMLEAYTLR